MLDTESYKYTLILSDIYCFSTAAMVIRTRLYATFYVHWRSCLLIKLHWTQACTFCVLTTLTLSPFRWTPKFLTMNPHEYPLQGYIITSKFVDELTHTHKHTHTQTHTHTHTHISTHVRTHEHRQCCLKCDPLRAFPLMIRITQGAFFITRMSLSVKTWN